MRAPFAPPRLSLPRNVEADAHAVRDELRDRQPGAEDLALERGDVRGADSSCVTAGIGSCQISVSCGTSGPR